MPMPKHLPALSAYSQMRDSGETWRIRHRVWSIWVSRICCLECSTELCFVAQPDVALLQCLQVAFHRQTAVHLQMKDLMLGSAYANVLHAGQKCTLLRTAQSIEVQCLSSDALDCTYLVFKLQVLGFTYSLGLGFCNLLCNWQPHALCTLCPCVQPWLMSCLLVCWYIISKHRPGVLPRWFTCNREKLCCSVIA